VLDTLLTIHNNIAFMFVRYVGETLVVTVETKHISTLSGEMMFTDTQGQVHSISMGQLVSVDDIHPDA
jgi:uncharacterized cupin superfamily protein